MNFRNSNNFGTQLTSQLINRLTNLLFYLSILIFIIGFNFTDVMVGNWYQQFMPNIGGRSINDVFFLDSLTGWAVTNATNQNSDTTYVLKTTNAGDNWVIQYRKVQTGGGFPGYFRVYFLNQNTGFTCGVMGIDRSTNGGASWTSLNAPLNSYLDMSVINENTLWSVSSNSLTGGVFFTSNGGASWQQQLILGPQNPNHIYMFNAQLGFICRDNVYLRRTTDGGGNWTVITGAGGFTDMYFIDSLTGWRAFGNVYKTTNSGLNWVVQVMPSGGNIIVSSVEKISNINKDTIWAVGAYILTGSGVRGMLDRTTNGGDTWKFQVPDSVNIPIGQYHYVDFINKLNGWAYRTSPTGIHTTTGGDTTFFLPVTQISSEIPKQFRLRQNYPNPFNANTTIRYELRITGYAKVSVYDIAGKHIIDLVNQKQTAGTYQVDLSGNSYSSGVYFYSLIVEGVLIDTKKMLMIK